MQLEPLFALASPLGASRVLAFDHETGRFVDLRIIPNRTSSETKAQILREAEAHARVQNPRVARNLGPVEDSQLGLAVAFEWHPGVPLGRALKISARTRVPFRICTILVVIAALTRALSELHDEEVAHDNVSTWTVLLGFDGSVTLLDIGMSSYCAELERRGSISPFQLQRFRAPERVMGQQPEARSDLFSAGVVLWEALTGRHLFDAPTHESLTRQVIACAARPPSLVARVSDAFDALVLSLLARSPCARPSSGLRFSRSVESLMREAGVSESPAALLVEDLSKLFGAGPIGAANQASRRVGRDQPNVLDFSARGGCQRKSSDGADRPPAPVIRLSDFRSPSRPPEPPDPREIAQELLQVSGERFRRF